MAERKPLSALRWKSVQVFSVALLPIDTDVSEANRMRHQCNVTVQVLFMAASGCGEASPATPAENHRNCQTHALLPWAVPSGSTSKL